MDKLKMHSPDLSQENIAKIRDLFPSCVTEARDNAAFGTPDPNAGLAEPDGVA